MTESFTSNLLGLMRPRERRRALGLLGLMLVAMVLEALGIGLVVPAVALITRPDFLSHYPRLMALLPGVGAPSRESLVVAAMLVLLAMAVVRAGFLAFVAAVQMRFVYGLQQRISQRLFAGYLRQPYAYHLGRNSAELIRNTLGDVDLITQHGILQALNLTTEVFVVVGIFALLMYVEPLGAMIAVGTLVLAAWAFSHLMRNRITRWSRERQTHEGARLQHLQQGLGAVKEVKLLGREAEFVEQYALHTRASARATRHNQLLQQLPRLALEMLAMVAMATLVIAMIWQHRPLEALLPTMGVFAAAAFRVMPSANRIINAIQGIRFAAPVMTSLSRELATFDAGTDTAVAVERLQLLDSLRVQDVVFRYEGASADTLRGMSLEIRAGESVGFIGGSGAGKSTLVDVILGLLEPNQGRILVDGVDIQDQLRGWQNCVGYVPQRIYLTDDTLERNIAFGLAPGQIDRQALERALSAAQLDEFIGQLPEGLQTKVGERGVRLSGGQLQRIGIARALYHDPAVLVLDEATSALDPATERSVMQAVKALHGSKTVIIVTHRLSTVEECDRVYRVEGGTIVDAGDASRIIAAAGGLGRAAH